MLEADGLFTLLLSNAVIVVTGGVFFLLQLQRVVNTARRVTIRSRPASLLLVLGMRLRGGEVRKDYARRLDRALALYGEHPGSRILVLGGSPDGRTVTEADRGKAYLVSRGIDPDHILLEDASRHTLENLFNARRVLAAGAYERVTLISSRYHLARCQMIAAGLGLHPELCAAEDRFSPTAGLIPRLFLEAYYLHWYQTGAVWSRLVRSHGSLARIS